MENHADITIRKATKSDLARIAEVHRASIQEIGSSFYTADIIAVWGRDRGTEGYEAALEKNGETYFIAEESMDKPLLGFSSHIYKNGEHHLAALYVRSSAARKGIGRRLLAAVEDIARANRAQYLHTEGSLSGEAFYRASGFAEQSRGKHPMSNGTTNISVDIIYMIKPL